MAGKHWLIAGVAAAYALGLAGGLSAQTPDAGAGAEQEEREAPIEWRRWVYGLAGALVGAVPAWLADRGDDYGWCASRTCSVATAGGVAGAVGYLIGRERDQAVKRRWAVGPDLPRRLDGRVELEFPPKSLVAAPDGEAVVIGEWGIGLIGGGGVHVTRYGGEIRDLRSAVVVPGSGTVLAATGSGLYAFPATAGTSVSEAVGRRLHPMSATAVVMLSPDGLAAGGPTDVLRLSLDAGDRRAVAQGARAHTVDTVAAAAYSPETAVVWTLEGRRLQARQPRTLERTGHLEFDAEGRELAVAGGLAAVITHRRGVHLVDVSTPASPRKAGPVPLGALHFALDVALTRDRLFVAGGDQGLLVLDVADPTRPRVEGVVRDIGSVDDVVADGSTVWVTDRRARTIRRIRLDG